MSSCLYDVNALTKYYSYVYKVLNIVCAYGLYYGLWLQLTMYTLHDLYIYFYFIDVAFC